MKYFVVSFRFGVLVSLMFLIYCVILSLKITDNSSRHSGAIRKENIHLHSSDPPPTPTPFKKGGVNFNYLPQRGGDSEKLKRGGESMVQRQIFLKGGGTGTFPI